MVVWSSAEIMCGVLYVMMDGIQQMPELFVENWASLFMVHYCVAHNYIMCSALLEIALGYITGLNRILVKFENSSLRYIVPSTFEVPDNGFHMFLSVIFSA